jgi:glyoxylase-like metal-dependent hydrolase (beta-lactamase superfamily II)
LQVFEHESELYHVETFVSDNRWKANAYLVTAKQTRRSYLIDPGGVAEQLLPMLSNKGNTLVLVLLTHGHFDHMSSAAAICEEFAVSCALHQNDKRLVRQAPLYALRFDGSQVSVPAPVITFGDPGMSIPAAPEIQVIHTPGHTRGSVCYVVDGIVFTGDTLLVEAVGRTDQPGGSKEDLNSSVCRLLNNIPRYGVILPGHGKPWSVAAARLWWQDAADSPPVLDRFL